MKYVIDATNRPLGRIASEAATVLIGKKSPGYARNKIAPVEVLVENASKVKITAKKLNDKVYRHHTGYRGNLKEVKMSKFLETKGYKELVRRTVYGMLPINKLRPQIIKNLKVVE